MAYVFECQPKIPPFIVFLKMAKYEDFEFNNIIKMRVVLIKKTFIEMIIIAIRVLLFIFCLLLIEITCISVFK